MQMTSDSTKMTEIHTEVLAALVHACKSYQRLDVTTLIDPASVEFLNHVKHVLLEETRAKQNIEDVLLSGN